MTTQATQWSIIRSDERGHTEIGWLDSRHSFSFGEYFDPARMGFRSLRVINDDLIAGGAGFGMHGHRDMEIISYMACGALAHKDSLGNGSVIRPGEIQYMSAGKGIRHSEFNPSPTETSRLLQIWIVPCATGLPPKYEQEAFTEEQVRNRLALLASPEGKGGLVGIRQDAWLYAARLDGTAEVHHDAAGGRGVWIQVVTGNVTIDGQALSQGDAAVVDTDSPKRVTIGGKGEVLLFDLA